MLERLGKVASRGAKATVLAGAVVAAYAGYEFYEGGRDRVHERYDAARGAVSERATAAWDKTKTYGEKTADRLQDDPTNLLLIVLSFLVPVLYYRVKGHTTGDALVAAVTRTPLTPRAADDGPLDAVGRAKTAAELKAVEAYRAESAAKRAGLPKQLAAAKTRLTRAEGDEAEAADMLAAARAEREDAEGDLDRLEMELARATAEEDELAERVGELKRRLS
jgi:hypothetical protein